MLEQELAGWQIAIPGRLSGGAGGVVVSLDSRGAVDSRIRFTGSIHGKILTEVDSRSIHFEIR